MISTSQAPQEPTDDDLLGLEELVDDDLAPFANLQPLQQPPEQLFTSTIKKKCA